MPSLINFGGNTGRQPIQDRQAGFAGGLNTVSDPAALTPDQARDLTNFRLTTYGAAAKRLGTKLVSSVGFPIIARRACFWPTKNTLIWGGGTGSSASIYATGPTLPTTATALTGHTTTQVYPIDFAVFSDGSVETMYVASANSLLYGSITTTSLQKTNDASTLSATIASVPSPISGLCVYNSRLWGWAAGLNNSLYYSNLSTAGGSIGGDSLGVGASGGGQIIITTFGASNIIAAQPVGSSLLIFHQRGISRLTGFGQSDITVLPQSLAADVGLWSRTAIDEYNGVAYFVSPRGLYTATENEVAPVGTPARPDPLAPVLKTLALSANGVIVKFNRDTAEVWVSIDGVGVYVYHTILQAWAGPMIDAAGVGNAFGGYGANVSCMTEIVDANGFPHLWVGGVGAGLAFFMQCDDPNTLYGDRVPQGSPGGQVFTAKIQCHRMFGGSAYVAGTDTTLPVGSSTAKAWRMVNVLATLDSGINTALPTVASTTVAGGTQTVTITNPTSTEKTYYNASGGAGPYIDVVITDASAASLGGGFQGVYASVDVEGFALGTR